jgi:hypothetical protein
MSLLFEILTPAKAWCIEKCELSRLINPLSFERIAPDRIRSNLPRQYNKSKTLDRLQPHSGTPYSNEGPDHG